MTELTDVAGDRWVPVCGGTEKPTKARTVRTPLHMNGTAKVDHAHDEFDRSRVMSLADVEARDTFAPG